MPKITFLTTGRTIDFPEGDEVNLLRVALRHEGGAAMPTIEFRTSGCKVEFAEGDEVNMLRVAIRNDCDVPYKCASGNCGTDRVKVEEGAGNLSLARRRERDTLGPELVAAGYRLACQTYVLGDVSVSWDPDQVALISPRAEARLREKWLAGKDTD